MWAGMMLSLVLCQATDAPVVKAISLNESRNKTFEKGPNVFAAQSNLYLNAQVQGAQVKELVKTGNLKVTEAVDDQKTDLILKQTPTNFMTTDKPDYAPLFDFERQRVTKEGIMPLTVVLHAPARTAKKISVKGSIDLLNGTTATIDFDKAKSLEGTDLKSPELDALKLKVSIVKPGKNFFGKPEQVLMVKFDGDVRPIVDTETILVDAKGKKIEGYSNWEFRQPDAKDKTRTLYVGTNTAIPADAKLQIKYIKNAKVVTVPFEFKDIELP